MRVDLYGSLAWTGRGRSTDKAVILGLAGEAPETIDPDRADELVAAIEKTRTLPLGDKAPVAFHAERDIVLATAAQKKLFFNLRRLKGQIQAIEEGDLTPEHVAKIAKELEVPEGDVISMNRRLIGADHSLNAPLRVDGEGEWQDWLVDDSPSQEANLSDRQEIGFRRDLLHTAMTHLTERERDILTERRLKEVPTTLEDLSAKYGISRERVRQIEVRAFEKLQKAIKSKAMDRQLLPG